MIAFFIQKSWTWYNEKRSRERSIMAFPFGWLNIRYLPSIGHWSTAKSQKEKSPKTKKAHANYSEEQLRAFLSA
jgi:hypothetical protein